MFHRTIGACVAAFAFVPLAFGVPPSASKDLKIIAIDVEGGAAVLFVTPEGKSLLIDTGWPPGIGGPRPAPGAPPPPPMPSSADRIAAAAAS
jgi:competence protein ComEC